MSNTPLPASARDAIAPPADVEPVAAAHEEIHDEPAPDAPASLAGTYRVTHGSLTLGSQQIATRGSVVWLGEEDARSALATKTVEPA